MRELLSKIEQAEFKEIVEGLISIRKQKFTNLFSKANFHIGQISQHRYEFERDEEDIKILEKLELEDCKKLFDRVFCLERKRLEIHLSSVEAAEGNLEEMRKRVEAEKDCKIVENVELMKARMKLYPDYFAKF